MKQKLMKKMLMLRRMNNILKIKRNFLANRILKKMMNIKNLTRKMKKNSNLMQFWKGFFLKGQIIQCTILLTFMKI
jgi:hypothetical protein